MMWRGLRKDGENHCYPLWSIVLLAYGFKYVAAVDGFLEEVDTSTLQSAADFAKEMDIESERLRQFPSSAHHPLNESLGQTDAGSNRDIPREVTLPPNTPFPTNGTRSRATLSTARWNPTRRSIYIRGHLLSHLDTRRINSDSLDNGAVVRRPLVDGVRKEDFSERATSDEDVDDRFNYSSIGRRPFMAQSQQLHGYKFLHGAQTQIGDARPGLKAESQYHALLNSVGALLASAALTATVCMLVGLSRQRIKTGVEKCCCRRRDRMGDYERVDSVSSLVDSSTSSQLDIYLDDPRAEDISII